MIMIIDKFIFRFFSYIGYYWKAQSNHYIHSPFIFSWVNTIKQNLSNTDHTIIQYRNSLAKDMSLFIYQQDNKEVCVSVSDRYRKTTISDDYGKILASTCLYLNAKNFLELGTSLGVSAAYLVSARPTIKGVTLDSNIHAISRSQGLFNTIFPHHQVEFKNGTFKDTLPKVLQAGNEYDFVFIDGDHHYESAIDYVSHIKSFLSENAVIVLDDIRWSRGMFKAWKELIYLPEFNYTIDFGRIGLLFKVNNHSPKQHFFLY